MGASRRHLQNPTMTMPARSRAFSLLALSALIGAGIWLWSASADAGFAPPVPQQAADVTSPTDVDAVEAATVDDPADAASREALEREVPESLFLAADDEANGRKLVTVQVWDRDEGVAAAGADVFVMNSAEADWDVTRGPFALHWSSVAERRGRRFRTDEEGRVDVPGFANNSVVVAKAAGAYAFKWVGEVAADGQVEVLTMEADEAVTIKVVDERGAPVPGAAVGVVERIPLAGPIEELQARAEQLGQWVDSMRQWMSSNPDDARKAGGKFSELQEQLRETRQELEVARVESERRKRQGGLADQRPLARLEVRTRRLTDEDGLAVVEHFQLYRRPDEREAKQQKRGAAKTNTKKAAGRGKAAGARGGKGAARGGKGAARGDKGGARGGKGAGKGAGKGGQAGKNGFEVAQLPSTFEAALLMPLTAPVTKEISVDPLPEGVIELQKPLTAALALRTVDRDGRPFTHPVRGQLELIDDESSAWSRVMLRKEQDEETIEFPHVGLGLVLQASCRLDDDDFRWQSGGLQGPIAAGERLEVDLVVAPEAGMLFAKLVDAAGAPLGGVSPSFLISARGGRLEGEEVTTDRAGRFHLPYKVREGQVAPYRFEVRLDDAVPTRGFASPLSQLPVATVTDLGEIALDDLSAFARGVVVDDSGAAVAGASLQLERERAVGDAQEMRYVEEPFVRAETSEDGSFQLFGDFAPGRYRFRVEKREHFRTFADVSSGDQLRVEMTRKCRVVGTVVAPEWMNRKRVRVELRPVAVSAPPGEAPNSREDQLHDHQGKTYAFFDWVRPGTYDVTFRLQGFPDAFLVIDRLVLKPGQIGLHPRMQDLDLGAYIFRFEIYPVDENGQGLSVNRPQLAKIMRRDGTQQFIGLVMKGDYGEVFNTAPQLEVMPMMNGYVADKQILAPGRSELVFRSVPPVDVVLHGLSALAQEVPVHVQLQQVELDGRPESLEAFDGMSKRIAGWYDKTRHGTGRLDEVDTARVRVSAEGAYKVVLLVGPLRRSPQAVELDAVNVELVPGGEALRLVAPYEVAVVQQAIEAARATMAAQQGVGNGK